MNAYLGAATLGFILAFLALGLVISYRVFRQLDLTTDGSFALGAAVAATLIASGHSPLWATLAAVGAGVSAGACTSALAHHGRLAPLLSGILVTTSLLSVTVLIMRSGNLPLLSDETPTLVTWSESVGHRLFQGEFVVDVGGSRINTGDVGTFLAAGLLLVLVATAMIFFFRSHLGVAVRSTGDNPQMASAQGVAPHRMHLVGLAVANGMVGLSGALFAQYQGFADYRMGVGMVVTGLASLMLGEAVFGRSRIGRLVAAAVVGAVAYRCLVVVALNEVRLSPNALQLLTAVFVLIALIVPRLWRGRASEPGTV